MEFKGAGGGESRGGRSRRFSLYRGEELVRPFDSELLVGSGCAILIQPALKPGAPIQGINALVFLLLILPLNA